MAAVELTDKPCPECGMLLEVWTELNKSIPYEPGATVKVDRTLVCPECGYRKDADAR